MRATESTRDILLRMYAALRERFGHQSWWPATPHGGPLEICVGAILTQNTNWTNVERALANLHAAHAMSIRALHALPVGELAELIRPAGYFNVKARRVHNFIHAVWARNGNDLTAFLDRPTEHLRHDLLRVSGIGKETADSMILYAAGKPRFVVDAYTRRVLRRHGLIAASADYDAMQALFESALPADVELWNDYHAQIVAVGKYHCRPTPRCENCPLQPFPHDPDAPLDAGGRRRPGAGLTAKAAKIAKGRTGAR